MTRRSIWYIADKPHIIWSPHYRCWICAARYRDGSGDSPASAYEAWTKSC